MTVAIHRSHTKLFFANWLAILFAATLLADVVIDNNLAALPLDDLESNKKILITPIPVVENQQYWLQGWVRSTNTGIDMGDYNVISISLVNPPTALADLIDTYKYRTWNESYPDTQHTLLFHTPSATTEAYLVLGAGRLDGHGAGTYSWAVTNLFLCHAPGGDTFTSANINYGPNLVPNASFENPNLNFWKSGNIVPGDAKQGDYLLEVTSATSAYIAVSVTPEVEYMFVFWSASPEIGNGHMLEYGFSKPTKGWNQGTGNTRIDRYFGGGNIDWKKYSGTFTPESGQTTFYIGGMANGGKLHFDSVFIGARIYPPVGTLIVVR